MDVVNAFRNRLFGYKYNLTLLLLAASSFVILHSPVSLEGFLHDHFVFLTGAYRILEGQTPHVDFQTPFGGLSFLLVGGAHLLSGSYSYSIPLATLTLTFLIILSGSFLLHRKLDNKYYTLTVFFCLLVCVSPYVETLSLSKTSYAMWYNRHGWACFIVVSLYVLHRDAEERFRPTDIACLTILSVILAYTKPTFLIALVPILLIDLFFHNQRGMYYFAFSALLVAGAVELAVPGFSIGYIHDLLSASEYSGVLIGSGDQNLMYLAENLLWVLCFLFSVVIKRACGELAPKSTWEVASVFFATWWLTNQAALGVPLGLVAVPIWAGSTTGPSPTSSRSVERWRLTRRTALFGLALLITVPTMGKRLWTLGDYVKEGYTDAGDPSLSVPFEGFDDILVSEGHIGDNFPRVGRSNLTIASPLCKYTAPAQQKNDVFLEVEGSDYIQSLQAAIDLTEQHVPPNASVFTLDFVNPINLLTDRPPIPGNRLWYHKNRTFNSEHLGPPEQWLGSVRYVLIPKIPVNYSSRNELLQNAGCFLENTFETVERNALWILLKRPATSSVLRSPQMRMPKNGGAESVRPHGRSRVYKRPAHSPASRPQSGSPISSRLT